jgi:hypothetical protein
MSVGFGPADLPEGLVRAKDGNFYGFTIDGGTIVASFDCGTLFELTFIETLTAIHSFGDAGMFNP